jgi:hypothetical protein
MDRGTEKPPEAPESLTIVFRTPIMLGETGDQTRYADLTLREPTVSEMIAVAKLDGLDELVELIRVVAAVPQGVVRQMKISQLREAAEYLAVFTQGARWKGAPA